MRKTIFRVCKNCGNMRWKGNSHPLVCSYCGEREAEITQSTISKGECKKAETSNCYDCTVDCINQKKDFLFYPFDFHENDREIQIDVDLEIMDFLDEISKEIPIEWDRFNEIKSDDFSAFQIFGWINRSDFKRDFIDVWVLNPEKNDANYIYATSSAKYSKKLAENMGSSHTDCIKFEEFKKRVDEKCKK